MYYVRTLVNPSVVRPKSNKCIDMFFTALLPNVPTAKEVSNEGKKSNLLHNLFSKQGARTRFTL